MLRLTTKLKIRSKITVKCEKHPRYNPEKDGKGGVRGACSTCLHMYTIFNTHRMMMELVKDFEVISKPYEAKKPLAVSSPTSVV
jgi:hypothetical protein